MQHVVVIRRRVLGTDDPDLEISENWLQWMEKEAMNRALRGTTPDSEEEGGKRKQPKVSRQKERGGSQPRGGSQSRGENLEGRAKEVDSRARP